LVAVVALVAVGALVLVLLLVVVVVFRTRWLWTKIIYTPASPGKRVQVQTLCT
jgi:hypothetical protein